MERDVWRCCRLRQNMRGMSAKGAGTIRGAIASDFNLIVWEKVGVDVVFMAESVEGYDFIVYEGMISADGLKGVR